MAITDLNLLYELVASLPTIAQSMESAAQEIQNSRASNVFEHSTQNSPLVRRRGRRSISHSQNASYLLEGDDEMSGRSRRRRRNSILDEVDTGVLSTSLPLPSSSANVFRSPLSQRSQSQRSRKDSRSEMAASDEDGQQGSSAMMELAANAGGLSLGSVTVRRPSEAFYDVESRLRKSIRKYCHSDILNWIEDQVLRFLSVILPVDAGNVPGFISRRDGTGKREFQDTDSGFYCSCSVGRSENVNSALMSPRSRKNRKGKQRKSSRDDPIVVCFQS
ncbi:hypothetical protein ROZALSC1DRAFT_29227, partial [Rozella allomycis CSF55]